MSNDQGQGGYPGQHGLAASVGEFNKHDSQIWAKLAYVRTAIPVVIKAVHVDSDGLAPVGSVDVQPLVNQMDGEGNSFPHGTIFNLPYVRMQGGTNAVICDPVVGDNGIAVICDRDISSVKANKKQANPGSRRRFGLADGIYIGGLLNGTPEQYVRFTTDGMSIVDKSGNKYETSSSGIVATPASGTEFKVVGKLHATDAVTFDSTLHVLGNATFDGSIQALSAAITTSISAASATLSGALAAASAAFTGAITAASTTLTGTLTAATVSAVTGTFSGALSALSASISAAITAVGNITSSSGNVVASGQLQGGNMVVTGHVAYSLHAHGGVTSGGAVTGTPN